MKRPIITNQNLSDVPDIVIVKTLWHGHNKQQKMKIAPIGDADSFKFRAECFKYAFKSVNIQGYRSLVSNLI